ncbi:MULTISPECIES: aldo/keto reductase [Paenibacillus]|uniref:Diketogulonate reductase-like aldo/keto reductase n=1 Tax=Paenibacillus pabuli TaxID=1472 RepID=A0A855YAI5_9BACL|nr:MULTISPECIES: aldo/keto reductase [Paenibacillus]PWW42295.1 diketogulonate reductase-like aldo/keto reductase [Paenibacillus pabuli]PXW07683.1 diketogulonate reductase-like aldo/keto reductase [Paenibacillus taichungensis]RAI94552.1 diketogulonate reductase-like aldo/keto reductase [Paenibacillus pabuli]SEO94165.1 Aldo/keto reductase [Paenibacillus sp. OK076]
MKHVQDTTTLYNGVKMPWLGFGVFKVKDGEEVVEAVKTAIQAGYRSIDTAKAYNNETGVAQGIRESGIAREDLFITTKVWNGDQGYESTLAAFEASMERLELEYLDLYLIHWPVKGKYKDTWRALEKLHKEGRIRAIGVSNFQIHHLEDLMTDATIKPAVNQVELHPLLIQTELREYCSKHQIQIEAWSPLGQGHLLEHPLLLEIAAKYSKSPAQVILRWDLQNGIVTIPKSVTPQRIRDNADLYDFELTTEEIERINQLNENKRFGSDPDNFNF